MRMSDFLSDIPFAAGLCAALKAEAEKQHERCVALETEVEALRARIAELEAALKVARDNQRTPPYQSNGYTIGLDPDDTAVYMTVNVGSTTPLPKGPEE